MQLNQERAARLDAEESVSRLRGELSAIAEAEAAARAAAQESLAQLQTDYESAKVCVGCV